MNDAENSPNHTPHSQPISNHINPSWHFTPPITHQDFQRLSQLSKQQLSQLPLTRSDLRKIMLLKEEANQQTAMSAESSEIPPPLFNPLSYLNPPRTAEDFERLSLLNEQELAQIPLTRSDYEALHKIKQHQQQIQSHPEAITKSAQQFAQLQQWQLHQPFTEQDFEVLLQLEKWQLARLPLTLADRQKLFSMMQERQKLQSPPPPSLP